MKNEKTIYLGLDIGTDSVGYAVTDEQYRLVKYHGEPAWGVTLFDAASLCDERRSFRTARRRLDRRKQRVNLIQELFSEEIAKVDPRFFIRLQESRLFREDVGDANTLFCDPDYSDKEYYREYPTIHHLIKELMQNPEPHDVRLVYLACSWLAAHRGHFLSNVDKNHIEEVCEFDSVYHRFMNYFSDNEYESPWECDAVAELRTLISARKNVSTKNKELIRLLFNGNKVSNEISESFPFSRAAIVKLLAGGTCKVKDLYGSDEYDDLGSVTLSCDDDKWNELLISLGDDAELLQALRSITDWAALIASLGSHHTVFEAKDHTVSKAKVEEYETHKNDLRTLKYFIRKYQPDKYDSMFRDATQKDNYVAYAYHTDPEDRKGLKKATVEDFSKVARGILSKIKPDEDDQAAYDDMLERLSMLTFLPKQKNTNNRVIPHQLYWYELNQILKNAESYLPFLSETDADGLTVKDKVLSVFMFRVPYFVGPLNPHSENAWIVRKAGKIYPWNFNEMVDLDASEQQFIQRMTNQCSYLPGEPVLPKDSLLYHRFMVLNTINSIRINGIKITVEQKQAIYRDLFMKKKKVTKKQIIEYFICNGMLNKGDAELVSGVDDNITVNLAPQIAFRKMLESGVLTEDDAERIVERSSYAEDKGCLKKWIDREFPDLSDADKKYVCGLKFKDFGRLSKAFLCSLEGAEKGGTGEVLSILTALWDTNDNLMELLSDRYTFAESIRDYQTDYYSEHVMKLSDRLDDLYVSNSVKRPIYRTLAIVKDIEKTLGVPKKIFVETTRGGSPDQKGKRTSSRREQIEALYQICADEDVRLLRQQLEAMGELADNKLQSEKLFLYYMQLGKCMYTGAPLQLEKLGSEEYNIDHIYPQAYVKDDSVINNKVLVLSTVNGLKQDVYPIADSIRQKMTGYWTKLRKIGLISEEKYKRLTRGTPFTDEEKYGFINRQLTETSQATKAVAAVLKEKYPDTEIVYCKARLASDFRKEFEIPKSRSYNDLHHAVDAYLNIVTGNVYNMKFSKKWFNVHSPYSMKTKTIFSRPLVCNGETVWDGEKMLAQVKKTATKNNAHFTKYAYFKRGGLFDQMPVKAAEGLVPIKTGLETEKYGGYNKAGAMFYIPVRYKAGKKSELFILSVELLHGKKFLSDTVFAEEYAKDRLGRILGKKIDEVTFPMGMRPWKVNTMLSLDGFRVCITGIAGAGKCLIAQSVMQFSDDKFWCYYLKKIEKFVEKKSRNANYVYDEQFDVITKAKNQELYELYISKYQNSIYRKRINNPVLILQEGRELFEELTITDQAKVLLNIHATYGRISGGCDLSLIGGGKFAAATGNFSTTIKNWTKHYSDVRIIDQSVTGLKEKQSENLLELL